MDKFSCAAVEGLDETKSDLSRWEWGAQVQGKVGELIYEISREAAAVVLDQIAGDVGYVDVWPDEEGRLQARALIVERELYLSINLSEAIRASVEDEDEDDVLDRTIAALRNLADEIAALPRGIKV